MARRPAAPQAPPDPDAAVAALCPGCGLCCDGSLFADVRLRPSDHPARLAAQGLSFETSGRARILPQPCTAWVGGLCGVYEQRPGHCRRFECGVLRSVIEGRRTTTAARAVLRKARQQVDRLHRLLLPLGQNDLTQPLVRRYAAALAQPADLARPAEARTQGQLLRDMQRWMDVAGREFLGLSATSRGTRSGPVAPAG